MCQIVFSCSVNAPGLKSSGAGFFGSARFLSFLVFLSLCTAVVFLGGLSALQNECFDDGIYAGNTNDFSGTDGFSAGALNCKRIYRYYWFIVSFQIAVGAIAMYATMAEGKLTQLRNAILALFVVATLLFIQSSEAFLGVLDVPLFQNGTARDRSKTTFAGAVMTATLNALIVLVSGYNASA